MTRALMLTAFLWLPLTAAAQPAAPADAADPERNPARSRLAISSVISDVELSQQPQPVQPARSDRRRRRPSMVGYVNDAGLNSQVRIRFDAGGEIDSADRAEFFYAKCGCFRSLPSDHPAYDPDAPGPGPGIATGLNFQQLYLQAQYGLNDRVALYGELPVRWLQPQSFVPGTGSFGDQSGISDLRAGVKFGLVNNDTQLLTFQVQGNFPTGDGLKGLGVEHFSFEPALLYNQTMNERLHLEGQFGVVLPAGSSKGIATAEENFAGNVIYYGIGPSVEIYRSEQLRVAPVVELVGWHVIDGFQTSTLSEVDGVNVVNLKVGGRFGFGEASSLYAGYGRALTDSVWYENVFRLEYRFDF